MSTADSWTRTVGDDPVHVVTELPPPPNLTGPGAPGPGVTPPLIGLDTWIPDGPASVWWVGAHGGAGETTLAGAFPGSRAAGHRWPIGLGAPAKVVIVARTHATGLLAARSALQQWAAPGGPAIDLLGLVFSADIPGKTPKALRDLERVVAGGAPRSWRLPYFETWRVGQPDTPPDVTRLLGQVASLLNPR